MLRHEPSPFKLDRFIAYHYVSKSATTSADAHEVLRKGQMIQGHPYFFIRSIAQEILAQAKFVQVNEKLEPDVFGSAYSDFSNGKVILRIIWDGRDGWGFATKKVSPTKWDDIPVYLTEGDVESRAMNEEKIVDFCAQLHEAVI